MDVSSPLAQKPDPIVRYLTRPVNDQRLDDVHAHKGDICYGRIGEGEMHNRL